MLYLLKSGNYLKIGYAKNIEERMKLYTHNPEFEKTRKQIKGNRSTMYKFK